MWSRVVQNCTKLLDTGSIEIYGLLNGGSRCELGFPDNENDERGTRESGFCRYNLRIGKR